MAKKILLVEDEETILKLLSGIIEYSVPGMAKRRLGLRERIIPTLSFGRLIRPSFLYPKTIQMSVVIREGKRDNYSTGFNGAKLT